MDDPYPCKVGYDYRNFRVTLEAATPELLSRLADWLVQNSPAHLNRPTTEPPDAQ